MTDDPLEILDVRRERTDCLKNLLAGRSAFLVCGGPSAKPNLHKLNRRGVFALGVNNAAGNIARCQAFVCSDPPLKFSHSIWQDPAVMKFLPTPKMLDAGGRNILREKHKGKFQRSDLRATDCPNVWGFRRESFMHPDDSFYTTEGACWGNLDAGVQITGQPKTVCTMLLGMRLLPYLGASRVFLVGVDFRMGPDYGYSFSQARDVSASTTNNGQFQVVNEWLCKMQNDGVFARRGVAFYNTYAESGLRAFPYVDFDMALQDVVGKVEEEPDLGGWYEKAKCSDCNSFDVEHTANEKFKCCHCGQFI